MGAVGFVLYFGSMGYAARRSHGIITYERFIAVALIVALLFIGSNISGVVLLVAIDLILLTALVLEHRRFEPTPTGAPEETSTAT
ncbi:MULTISPECIES: hypothetical protein [Cryobacterium]|uniref:DUF2568 domain-containing protein n=1 Tax=Cryobacterium breve TaxID=1259258 RepID=A0ABY2IW73_9MICO|nr:MULTISPECIES: hypothetical protein [Cryobacterium]TFC96162.1 hypothetical protein E3O65_14100 [Cryobacterium breve]TFC98068.1 hypothetical protein E3T20_00230 [Cryobacterium sp. TmT3-12]